MIDLIFGKNTAGPGPAVSHPGPHTSIVTYFIGRTWLRASGWSIEGELPQHERWVMIAAPHTSNWDLPFMIATAWVFRVKLNWLGKHTLFKKNPAFSAFMRWLGGIPVDRRAPQGLVGQVVEKFSNPNGLFLGISPAGTRSAIRHWKSGFYRIAVEAQVPVICGFLDFERKVCGVGPTIELTGDIEADMSKIRSFYREIKPLYPERAQPIRLRDELAPA